MSVASVSATTLTSFPASFFASVTSSSTVTASVLVGVLNNLEAIFIDVLLRLAAASVAATP